MQSSAFRVVSTLALCFFAIAAQAQAQGSRPPERWGSRHTHASQAAPQLGAMVRPLAARYRRSEVNFRALLARERDLWLDRHARLVYRCETQVPAPAAAARLPEEGPLAAPYPLENTFALHSRPGATRKIYLDFDGHTTSGTWWNEDTGGAPITSAPFDSDGNPGSFSASELEAIQQCWQRVAEDFAPFELDVTTEDPGVDGLRRTSSGDSEFGVRVVISPTDAWFGGAGGVAYVGVFDYQNTGNDLPAFVFSRNVANTEKNIAEAASHEAGHTLGLSHDGKSGGSEYFSGNSGSSWAPIMGASYSKSITQWSRGEYSGASNTEDDVALMLANGAAYRSDDHGNTTASATVLNGTSPSAAGIIERSTDKDFFRFTTGPGPVTLSAAPGARGGNLDIKLSLYDASGSLVTSSDPAGLASSLSRTLSAGTYYVEVDGVGAGDPAGSGYSDYGSLGEYTLGAVLVAPVATGSLTLTAPNGGESWTAGSQETLTWSSSGLSGNVRLDYSTNGGTTWTPITSSTPNDGSESWMVPNAPTSQARVRVSAADNSLQDTSNASFTIVAAPVSSLTVTSPNGGENWTAGSLQTLTWTSTGVSGSVRIDYSTNGGASWVSVASSVANDGSESWTVPNAPSTNCRVRVMSTSGTISDVSNGAFTISGQAADAYEADDNAASAKTIAGGETQDRSVHVTGNADWVKIVLTRRTTVTLTTAGVTGGDTLLQLYRANGRSLITSNDNYRTGSRYSRIANRALTAGTYYVRVTSRRGTISAYTLTMTAR